MMVVLNDNSHYAVVVTTHLQNYYLLVIIHVRHQFQLLERMASGMMMMIYSIPTASSSFYSNHIYSLEEGYHQIVMDHNYDQDQLILAMHVFSTYLFIIKRKRKREGDDDVRRHKKYIPKKGKMLSCRHNIME